MKFIRLFEEIGINDIPLVGGKNASLGEMINNLSAKGVSIPSGFAITAQAYTHHLRTNNLEEKIKYHLATIKKENIDTLLHAGHEIRALIKSAPLPEDLVQEIKTAYQELEQRYGENCDVAVRSSATAEDLPEASFAGQQETYLNVQGQAELLRLCPDAFASLFTNRAISYRIDHDFDHMSVALSIGVQKMVRSDKASAGVIFTLDTESGCKDVVFITSAYGLGENVVQGNVDPDEFYVHKPTLNKGFKPILKKRLGSKLIKMEYASDRRSLTKNNPTSRFERKCFSLVDQEILELAKQAIIIEDFYSAQKGTWVPMDIEWAKDGIDGKLYIVQARPETIHSRRQDDLVFKEYILENKTSNGQKIITRGKSVGRKIATGTARVIGSAQEIKKVQPGDILVTDMTDPDWEPIMKIAAGIITNRGGRTCHAAIVSRELGIPAIVGTQDAMDKISDGTKITMDCSSGEIGAVYHGEIPFTIKEIAINTIKKLPVKLLVNIGNPDEAFNVAKLPVDGVGLARLEFIINNTIQIHPMALVQKNISLNQDEKKRFDDLTIEYQDKKQFFVDRLAQEAGTIAAAFYPRPVVIRMSDFKSNEYRELLGGQLFEPHEENPMIGFRGASRYYHEKYKDAFELECRAMKKIIHDMGLDNVKLMIPFVRTVEQGKQVIELMKSYGLQQKDHGLEIYMMCEVPSNVLLIEEFAQYFDGFSIGSNDLTQLTLAVDRDSALVAPFFDERDPAVMRMLELSIQGAQKAGKPIGICGQAPSDYPELSQTLIQWGISSLSLSPDAILKELLLLTEK
ncbi:MAG: Phosphoenolpyruvate synthase [candidate division TM6 bacterium GW2011_GWF2_38_10]|nr:MAG: Phosphoenolpyruvate synthase [candidate division TM6 bacterium GW2011_GWF2_38_10]